MTSEKNNDSKDVISDTGLPLEPSPSEKAFISEYLSLAVNGILIKKGSVTTRMFSMVNGSTVLAFTFSELEDSYIVGLPAAMVSDSKGTISAKAIAPVSMLRIYKHQIGMSAMPTPKFLLCYLVASNAHLDKIPGFFDEARKTQVTSLISALKDIVKDTEVQVATGNEPDPGQMQMKDFLKKMSAMNDSFEEGPSTRPKRSRNLKH